MYENCVFCRIVAGTEPATVLLRVTGAIVIVPLNPVVEGHAISIPERHGPDFTHWWDTTERAMYGAFEYALTLRSDYNIITSKGRAATQSVPHMHVHIVPRHENDGLALPWYSGKRHRPSRTQH